MFGYATDETEDAMPMSHHLATRIGYKLTEVRKNGTLPWVRPDGKTQVRPTPACLCVEGSGREGVGVCVCECVM